MAPTEVMASPRAEARIAGACYLFSGVAAVLGEAVLRGAPGYAAGNLAILPRASGREGSFMLWLLVRAADETRWRARAAKARG